MSEPTSVLTFEDLILRVARKIGVGFYGAAGDEALQAPTDAHDLAECKRIVNDGLRRVFDDSPPAGWRWARPTATVSLWPAVGVGSGITVSGGAFSAGQTVLTASDDVFFPTMEHKPIVITGVGTFTIVAYTSATQVAVLGDASTASSDTFAIAADGNFTLPQSFGGAYDGPITFVAGTNIAICIEWGSEGNIRRWRELTTVDTGEPRVAAVRPKPETLSGLRRRWELMVYPTPQALVEVQFGYDLHFDSLVNLTDLPPTPYALDGLIVAACLATAEKDIEEAEGPETARYREQLARAYMKDARSGPKNIGYFGNPSRSYAGDARNRINFPVGFNP